MYCYLKFFQANKPYIFPTPTRE